MRRYDNNLGRILIDEAAAQRDIQRARNAVTSLESANRRLQRVITESREDFVGQTGDAFRAAVTENIRINTDEARRINDIIRQIEAMIQRYRNADTQLAERFRKG